MRVADEVVSVCFLAGNGNKQGTGDRLARIDHRFIDMNNGSIYDTVSKLTWLKDANCFGYQDWDTAMARSGTLADGQCALTDGSKAGDWHLPTVDELRSAGLTCLAW